MKPKLSKKKINRLLQELRLKTGALKENTKCHVETLELCPYKYGDKIYCNPDCFYHY